LGSSNLGQVLQSQRRMRISGAQCIVPVLLSAWLVNGFTGEETVATGRGFSFILDSINLTMLAMGRNDYGQLGLGQGGDVLEPVELILENMHVVNVAVGAFHTLFVMNDSSVWASGRNNYGQLGLNMSEVPKTFKPVKLDISDVKDVSAGYAHSLILKKNGQVFAAGWNAHGQLGDDSTKSKDTLVQVLDGCQAIVAGYDFSYFLKTNKELWATGMNLGGQLGDGTRQTKLVPTKILDDVDAVAAGESHGMILKNDGTVWATGSNFDGQLGVGDPSPKAAPVNIGVSDVGSVFAGGDSSCYIGLDDVAYGAGSNRRGQLGMGNESSMLTWKMMDDGVHTLSVGEAHTVMVAEGTVKASGQNTHGELGDGTTESKRLFVEVHSVATTTAPPTTTTLFPPSTTVVEETTLRSPNDIDSDTALVVGIASATGLGAIGVVLGVYWRGRDERPVPDDEAPDLELVRAQM
jgi:hypothetical protein